jgi:hypothetical protein
MRKYIWSVIFLVCFSYAFANSCENLQVYVANHSNNACQLSQYNLYSGTIIGGTIPERVEAGTITQKFIIQQGYMSGPRVRLDYQCGQEVVTLVSHQGLCLYYGWGTLGEATTTHGLSVRYYSKQPSWWRQSAGEIRWNIQN